MHTAIKTGLALAIAGLLVITGCQTTTESTSPTTTTVPVGEVGSLAPDFTLTSLEGETVSLSDFAGTPLMLNFWATWCSPCRQEMPLIQQLYQEQTDASLAIVTINDMESQAEVEQFMQANGLSFPVLLDPNGSAFSSYAIRYIPTTFFIDAGGVIQQKKIGSFESEAEIQSYLSAIMP